MTTIAALNKKGNDVVSRVIQTLASLKQEESHFIIASPTVFCEAENAQTLSHKHLNSTTVIGCVQPNRLEKLMPVFAQTANATSVFEGRFYPSARMGFKSQLNQEPSVTHEIVLGNLLREVEGDFSVILAEPERILVARDPVGVQPLYYAENAELAALASNRTALWRLGLTDVCSFPSGNLASITKKEFEFKPVRTLAFQKTRQTTLEESAQKLLRLLEHSVRIRVHDVNEVAVAFSGGLDSSVVAFLAKKCGAQVNLIHVSLRGQPETEDAKTAADELELPLSVHLFEADDIERTVSKVVELIEEPNPIKAAIGIPFYWVAQKTAAAGFDVLLAGQGADELFGGYRRYYNEYFSHGAVAVRKTMFNDVVRLPESNLERDEKICGFHGVQLRLPFASFGIAEFALTLPVKLKIERKQDGLRKLVLRRLARNIGLPEAAVNKPKKAVQYATGVNAFLGKIARKRGLTVGEYIQKVFREHEVNR